MRLTFKQLQGLLKHKDSPFIRCVGFLYLRYGCAPEDLWTWLHPYLADKEEFVPSLHTKETTTIGKWVRNLLQELSYFGTLLPRIPTKIHDSIKVQLLLFDHKQERYHKNKSIAKYLAPGVRLRAMYQDEENDAAMYDAVIDHVETNEDGEIVIDVTFPEYGNSESVGLGDIEYTPPRAEGSRSRDRGRSHRHNRHRSRSLSRSRDRSNRRSNSRRRNNRGRSRSRSKSRSRSRSRSPRNGRRNAPDLASLSKEALLEQVKRKEREKAEAVGKDYAARPASYKGALSMKIDRFTTRKRSRSASPRERRSGRTSSSRRISSSRREDRSPRRKEISEIRTGTASKVPGGADKLRMLREKYGDASSSHS